MKCEEFQFLAGALPHEMNWKQRLHWIICRACARYLREMRELDRRIESALVLEPPALIRPHLPPR